MYDERKERFSVRDLIIQVLFVAVFVVLLLWLFPMKGDVKSSVSKAVSDAMAPFNDRIFNENIMSMKDSAISYYTNERLPKKVGDEERITLSKMLAENIILPFTDSKGNQCDLNASYVSITKMNNEYVMKINLKCSDQEDYLLVHLGCYDYCDECNQAEKPVVTPTVTPTVTPSVKPVVDQKKYEYEYALVINGKWGEYSDWSEWTTNVINKTDYRDVETKEEKNISYKTEEVKNYEPIYEEKQVQVGTKEETYTEDVTVTKYRTEPIYEMKSVQVDTKQIPYTENVTVTKYRTVPVYETKTVQTGTKQEAYTTEVTVTKYNRIRKFVKMEYSLDCSSTCKRVEQPVYEDVYEPYQSTETVTQYRTVPVYETKTVQTGTKQEAYTTTETVTKYKTEPVYEAKQVQVGTKEVPYTTTETVTKTRTVPVYETKKVQVGTKEVITTKQVPVVEVVTYYRSRTREYISGTIKTAWSQSQNDQSLIAAGYSLTGNSRQI